VSPELGPTAGTDALQAQVAAREAASRADAAIQGSRRSAAAARALGLAWSRPDPDLHGGVALEEAPTGVADALAPPAPRPTLTEAGPLPPGVALPRGGPAARATGALAAAAQRSRPEEPVMELRPTVVATDIDRVGDQLVVLRDRLELRDRYGTVRRTLDLDDIELVQVHRRLTSAALEITTRVATDLVIKGLRPESAEAARRAISELRPHGRAAGSEVDERTLVRALLDLHHAGILDDAELAAKKALVARRVERAEPL